MKKLMLGFLLLLTMNAAFSMQAALLVSLGMPDLALKSYFIQSKQFHVPLIIRGFYKKGGEGRQNEMGSFRDTADRIKALEKGTNTSGVLIDPLLFSAFDIKVVPALVVYDENAPCLVKAEMREVSPCQGQTFDVVYGNIPLEKSLSLIAEKSDLVARANYARALVKRGQVK